MKFGRRKKLERHLELFKGRDTLHILASENNVTAARILLDNPGSEYEQKDELECIIRNVPSLRKRVAKMFLSQYNSKEDIFFVIRWVKTLREELIDLVMDRQYVLEAHESHWLLGMRTNSRFARWYMSTYPLEGVTLKDICKTDRSLRDEALKVFLDHRWEPGRMKDLKKHVPSLFRKAVKSEDPEAVRYAALH